MSSQPRVFLLSPARCSGLRAELLVHSPGALGEALRGPGAPLGEAFAFLSSLYFRGKLAYASRFSLQAPQLPGALIITPGHGLCRANTRVRAEDLIEMGRIEVDAENPSFVGPLARDAELLLRSLGNGDVVLLGSIATPKYVDPLLAVFGARLLFPREFVGRGDMSRGGMMLRAAKSGLELDYVPVQDTVRRGKRAPRLDQL